MTKQKEHYYIARGKNDTKNNIYIYYGKETPIIDDKQTVTAVGRNCNIAGIISYGPLVNDIKDDEIIQIRIRKVKQIKQLKS